MGRQAARLGDQVAATDIHIVLVPPLLVPTALPHPFVGMITGGLSVDVRIEGRPAAVVGSTAVNVPPHLPSAPGTSFQKPPANQATITIGSPTVRINGKAAARLGDSASTCNDPVDLPSGTVITGAGTVYFG
jgi:uncharacterized Zn-binding protein involved in type VI secretion